MKLTEARQIIDEAFTRESLMSFLRRTSKGTWWTKEPANARHPAWGANTVYVFRARMRGTDILSVSWEPGPGKVPLRIGAGESEIRRVAEKLYAMNERLGLPRGTVMHEGVKPGLRRVSGEIFYWRPRAGRPVRPGMKVPPFSGRLWKDNEPHATMEKVFEAVRREDFGDRPSRIGSVMVCPTLEGFCAKKDWRGDPKNIVEVRVDGLTFTTDAEMWTEAVMKVPFSINGKKTHQLTEAQREAIDYEGRVWAPSYWGGKDSYGGYAETLVKGKVTVVGPAV